MEHLDEEVTNRHLNKMEQTKKTFKDYHSLFFLILIAIFIVVLIIAIVTLITNIEELKTDPLIFGMERNNYQNCQCVDQDGVFWYIDNLGHDKRTTKY